MMRGLECSCKWGGEVERVVVKGQGGGLTDGIIKTGVLILCGVGFLFWAWGGGWVCGLGLSGLLWWVYYKYKGIRLFVEIKSQGPICVFAENGGCSCVIFP